MASPPNFPPPRQESPPPLVGLIDVALANNIAANCSHSPAIPSSPDGIDQYGNEREALAEQAKFYNNPMLSDVILRVGEVQYYAHKLMLVRSSDVFARMLSSDWSKSGTRQVIDLVEDRLCADVFPGFLKFLYSYHVTLNTTNTLPVLILADKYNVVDLRKVCIAFACSYIIPKLQLKDVFHVWFQYATNSYHTELISSCVKALSEKMGDIMMSVEWETEWLNLEKQQLIEILRSSDLSIKDEFELWLAVVKWLRSACNPSCKEKYKSLLSDLIGHIRFPMMLPDQLCELEQSQVAEQYPDLFAPRLLQAYKYHALPLPSRAIVKEFTSTCFLLRNYTDLRWDKRFVISQFSLCSKCSEMSFRFSTRASTFPSQTWEWELKVHPRGISNMSEDFRTVLYSNLILDQPRPVEYLLSVVNSEGIAHSVSGRKNFSKTRYTSDTEIDKKVSVQELSEPNSPLLVDDTLVLQIVLKPVD